MQRKLVLQIWLIYPRKVPTTTFPIVFGNWMEHLPHRLYGDRCWDFCMATRYSNCFDAISSRVVTDTSQTRSLRSKCNKWFICFIPPPHFQNFLCLLVHDQVFVRSKHQLIPSKPTVKTNKKSPEFDDPAVPAKHWMGTLYCLQRATDQRITTHLWFVWREFISAYWTMLSAN